MIKLAFSAIICLGILFSIQVTYAEEELPLPEGKNIKEWESISAALVAEKRFSEAIIYLDKILEQEPGNLKALTNKAGLFLQLQRFSESLEISDKVLTVDPNRVSTLNNKALALGMLKQYEESFITFTKILLLEPENEVAQKSRARILSATPTLPTDNSKYQVHALVTVRDESGNLIGTTESTNARYLPSIFTEVWWKSIRDDGDIYGSTVFKDIIDSKEVEMFTKTNPIIANDNYIGMLTLERDMSGYTINIFEIFLPMIEMEKTDIAIVQWTIIKK